MADWIVTRHAGTVDWLQELIGYDCMVRGRLSEYDLEVIGPGDRVFGVLPVPLVKKLYEAGAEVYIVILEDGRPRSGRDIPRLGLYEWGPRVYRVEGLILSDHTLPVGGGGGL